MKCLVVTSNTDHRRLNENTATRANNNRLFDSQNNARGGHNTGDRFHKAAGNEPRRQYSMVGSPVNDIKYNNFCSR